MSVAGVSGGIISLGHASSLLHHVIAEQFAIVLADADVTDILAGPQQPLYIRRRNKREKIEIQFEETWWQRLAESIEQLIEQSNEQSNEQAKPQTPTQPNIYTFTLHTNPAGSSRGIAQSATVIVALQQEHVVNVHIKKHTQMSQTATPLDALIYENVLEPEVATLLRRSVSIGLGCILVGHLPALRQRILLSLAAEVAQKQNVAWISAASKIAVEHQAWLMPISFYEYEMHDAAAVVRAVQQAQYLGAEAVCLSDVPLSTLLALADAGVGIPLLISSSLPSLGALLGGLGQGSEAKAVSLLDTIGGQAFSLGILDGQAQIFESMQTPSAQSALTASLPPMPTQMPAFSGFSPSSVSSGNTSTNTPLPQINPQIPVVKPSLSPPLSPSLSPSLAPPPAVTSMGAPTITVGPSGNNGLPPLRPLPSAPPTGWKSTSIDDDPGWELAASSLPSDAMSIPPASLVDPMQLLDALDDDFAVTGLDDDVDLGDDDDGLAAALSSPSLEAPLVKANPVEMAAAPVNPTSASVGTPVMPVVPVVPVSAVGGVGKANPQAASSASAFDAMLTRMRNKEPSYIPPKPMAHPQAQQLKESAASGNWQKNSTDPRGDDE